MKRSIVTRSGTRQDSAAVASLRSKLTNRRKNVEPVAVKLEEQEANISEKRPSSASLSTGTLYNSTVCFFWFRLNDNNYHTCTHLDT